MLMNFCVHGLTIGVDSDKPCFENHEVKNLIPKLKGARNNGYLADHFVKVPVSFNLKFVCHVDIECIVISLNVGSQRSEAFEICSVNPKFRRKIVVYCEKSEAHTLLFYKQGKDFSHFNRPNCRPICFFSNCGLKEVDNVNLRITRTSGSSVPAVGCLEIWGVPSRSVSREVLSRLLGVWNRYLCNSRTEVQLSTVKDEPKEPCNPVLKADVEVPEEFLDPITCDIMLIPMTLPSGKTVDQSTLDKFYAAEEEWGRFPKDPFTGVDFSSTNKPLLNSILKTKIDKFLINNSDKDYFKNIARIIGSTPRLAVPGTSKSVDTQPDELDLSQIYSVKRDVSMPTSDSNSLFKKKKLTCDEIMDECLNQFPVQKTVKPPEENCSKCLSVLTLFTIPCKHLICRACLVELKSSSELKCPGCNAPFCTNDPLRYHKTE